MRTVSAGEIPAESGPAAGIEASMPPLPRGRHDLTRGQVEQSQRLRLAVAMAEACVGRGYSDTPVAAVLELAGVSRQTANQALHALAERGLVVLDFGRVDIPDDEALTRYIFSDTATRQIQPA